MHAGAAVLALGGAIAVLLWHKRKRKSRSSALEAQPPSEGPKYAAMYHSTLDAHAPGPGGPASLNPPSSWRDAPSSTGTGQTVPGDMQWLPAPPAPKGSALTPITAQELHQQHTHAGAAANMNIAPLTGGGMSDGSTPHGTAEASVLAISVGSGQTLSLIHI